MGVVDRFGTITELRTGKVWTPSDLERAADARAADLRVHGVPPRDRVVIARRGSAAFFIDLFAVWRLGACAVCITPNSTPLELETIASLVDASVVITEADVIVRQAQHRNDVVMHDDALMLLTSGTTGIPKAVVHTHTGLRARIALNHGIIGDEALARTLCVLPLHFGHGLIGGSLTALVSGHHLVLGSDIGPTLLRSLARVVDENRITFMTSVPATWQAVRRFCHARPSRALKRVHVGSAPLSSELWREVIEWAGTDDVVNAYGLTEAANWVAGASARTHQPCDGLVGRMWGGAAAVLRDDGTMAATGQGELAIQCPSLMRRYFSAATVTNDKRRDGWFRTGDLAELGPDGLIHLRGRLGQEINRGGVKVQPDDIEQALERHPLVEEACVFAVDDQLVGQRVGVAVVFASRRRADVTDLRKWLATRLSREKLPDRWFTLDELPKTDRGKVDRLGVARRCVESRDRRSRIGAS